MSTFASPMLRTPKLKPSRMNSKVCATVTTCAVQSTSHAACVPCARASCKWQVAVARQPRSLAGGPGAHRQRR